MFIFTTKFDRKKAVAIVIALAAILIGIILIAGAIHRSNAQTVDGISVVNIKTNEDRIAYLNALGWEVSSEPIEEQDIVIPKEFDGVYADYIKLQNEQGFTIADYCGMEAKRYTYQVLNYPDKPDGIVADIIVYRSTVIAGDIQSVALDGFMEALKKR